jgi:predicted GNAT family acetyltransferase
MPEPTVVHNQEESRFELHLDGQQIGRVDYRPAGDSVIVAHTEVDGDHEGEGLGSVLISASLAGIYDMGKTIIPTCPFAAAYIKRHHEWVDFVAPSMRDQFR